MIQSTELLTFNLAIYAALASAEVSISARAVLDALIKDIAGFIVTAAVVVF